MMHQNAMMLTTGDDETSPFTPLGVVNTPYGQTPQVCAVLCDRMIRSDTHNSTPPNPFARNTTCMAVRSDPERPTDTIRLTRVCEGQDPLLRLSFLGAPTPDYLAHKHAGRPAHSHADEQASKPAGTDRQVARRQARRQTHW